MIDVKQLTNEEILLISKEIRERENVAGPYRADFALEPGPWRPDFVPLDGDSSRRRTFILGDERESQFADEGFTNKYIDIQDEDTIVIREMLPVSCKFKLAPAPGGWDRFVWTGKIPFIVQGWGNDAPLNYTRHENFLTPLMEESIKRMDDASYVSGDADFWVVHSDNNVITRELENLENQFKFHLARDQVKLDELQLFSFGLTSDPAGDEEMIYYDRTLGLSATFDSSEAAMRYPDGYVDGEMHKAARLDYRLRYAIMWYMSTLLGDATVGTSKNVLSTEVTDIVAFALRVLPRAKLESFSRSIFEYIDIAPTGENVARTRVFERLVNAILDAHAPQVDVMKDVIFDLRAKEIDKSFISDQNQLDALGHGRFKLHSGGGTNLNMLMFGPHLAYDHTCNFCKISPVPDPKSTFPKGIIHEGFGISEITQLPTIEPVGGQVRISELNNEPWEWRPLSTPLKASIFEYERKHGYDKFHSKVSVAIPKFTYLPRREPSVASLYWALTTGNKSCLAGDEMVRVGEYPFDVKQGVFLDA